MTDLTATVDTRELIAALGKLGKRDMRAAASRAISRAGTTVRKEARDIAKAEVNIAPREINGVINISKRPTASRLEGEVRVKNKSIPMIDYLGERQTRKGVSVKVSRKGSRKVIPRTFIATMRSGHNGIFWRRKGEGPTGLAGRLPIDELFARTVRRAIDKTEHINRLLRTAEKRMAEVLKQELAYRLSRKT